MKIYHNPRCSKSRQALELLKESNQEFEVIEYLKEAPSEADIRALLDVLKISPIEMIRVKEKLFIEQFKGKELSDDDLILAMVQNPILIERPIVFSDKAAVIGRPTEKVVEFLSKSI